MWKRLLRPSLVVSVTVTMLLTSVAPTATFALPSESIASVSPQREAAITAILQALARPQAQMRLRLAGIRPAELQARLSQLDDRQLALVAERADLVNAAGDSGLGIVIGLLIITILVVVLVKLMDKEIEIKDRHT